MWAQPPSAAAWCAHMKRKPHLVKKGRKDKTNTAFAALRRQMPYRSFRQKRHLSGWGFANDAGVAAAQLSAIFWPVAF